LKLCVEKGEEWRRRRRRRRRGLRLEGSISFFAA